MYGVNSERFDRLLPTFSVDFYKYPRTDCVTMQELSPTTKAGVDVMNSFVSNRSLDQDEEELLLQHRILQSKAQDDRRARQRAEEELKFAKHKLQEREKKLEAQRQTLSKQQSEIYTLQKQLDERNSANATLKQQIEQLSVQLNEAREYANHQREQFQLARSQTASSASFDVHEPRSTRRGSNVNDLINEKAKNIKLTREMKSLSHHHMKSCQAMECALMYEADLHSALTQRNLARGITPINHLLKAEAGEEVEESTTPNKLSGLVSFEGIKRYGRGAASHLPFHEKLDLKVPDDCYIDAKINSSSFGPEFKEFRDGMKKFAAEWKTASDTALSALWFIFSEREKGSRVCVLQNPKEDFQKEVRTALLKTKTLIMDLIRKTHEGIKNILGNERKVKLAWLKEQHPSREFGCQVEIAPPEDPRIAQLSEEVDFLKLRIASLQDEHSSKTSDLEMQREKAEVNMQFLQQKVFALHTAVHNALHSVFKHRFHWGPRCPNHFAPLDKTASKKRQLEVGYNVQLGEAIDLEIKSLGQFADYFVSDQLFGVDLAMGLSGNSEKENDVSLVMRRKEAVPMKKAKVDHARRLSNQLDMMMKQEKAGREEVDSDVEITPPPKPQGNRTSPRPNPTPTQAARRGVSPPPAPAASKRNSPPAPAAAAVDVPPKKRSPSPEERPPLRRTESANVMKSRTANRSQSPRKPIGQQQRKLTAAHVDVATSNRQWKGGPLPPSQTPPTIGLITQCIPTTINLELDPNSVARPQPTRQFGNRNFVHRASIS